MIHYIIRLLCAAPYIIILHPHPPSCVMFETDQIPEHKRVYLCTARDKYPEKLSKFRVAVKNTQNPRLAYISSAKQDLTFRPIVAYCVGEENSDLLGLFL